MDLQILQEKKKDITNKLNASKQLLAKAEQSMQRVNAQIIRLDGQLELVDDMIKSMESTAIEAEVEVAQEATTSELDEQ